MAKDQGWTQEETIHSLIRKSGYHGDSITQKLFDSMECTRYQSSKQWLTYEEYVERIGKDPVKDAMTFIAEEKHLSHGSSGGGRRGWRSFFPFV